MKKFLLIIITCLTLTYTGQAQNYITKNGKISFFSKTPMEDISAVTNQALSVLNSKTGDLAFSVLITGFTFKKALMQEHFNDDKMESAKYAKSTFKGTIADISKVNFSKDGTYNVSVSGSLSIHGVTNKISVPGSITVKAGKVAASAVFKVLLADYKISISKIEESNISKSIELKVDCNYELK